MPQRGYLKAEQLDGYPDDPTLFLAGQVEADGSNKWLAPAGSGVSGSLILVESHTPSGVAQQDFTTGITSAYDLYLLVFANVVPANNNVDLELRFSVSGSFDTGNNYSWARYGYDSNGSGAGGQNGVSRIKLTNAQLDSTAGNGGVSGRYMIFPRPGGTYNAQIVGENNYLNHAGRWNGEHSTGSHNSTSDVDGIRLFFTSGNIASCLFMRLYGIAH